MPANLKQEKFTTHPGSDLRQLTIQYNNAVNDLQQSTQFATGDALIRFYGVGPNSLTAPLAIGSTTSRVGTAAFTMAILGVPVVKAIDSVGTAFGGLGTIPTGTWGLIAIDAVAAGTITYVSAAASYTTGYTTEALAIAANPARVTAKARIGYLTILAAAPGFVVGTDALSGASATTVNYYPYNGSAGATGTATNGNGIICCSGVGVQGGVAAVGSGIAWTGGRNGVLIPTAMARGSTDTRFSTTAFTYNANGLNDIPKAAVAAGTAFGSLGTIPADKWGLIGGLIDGAGTITYISAPANYTTGYDTEVRAVQDLANMFPTAGLCFFGYVTIKTKAATAFIVGTDALAGGASGNVASFTNYYPTAGINYGQGISAAQIAQRTGVVIGSTNY